MKRRIFIVAMIAMAAFLLNGLGFLISLNLAGSVRNRMSEPVEAYQFAVSSIDAKDSLSFQIKTTTTHTAAGAAYKEAANATVQYTGRNTEAFQASVDETLDFGSYTTQIRETYAEETVYLDIQDSQFYSSSTALEFTDRRPPAVLLDPALYKTITGTWSKDGSEIHFEAPAAPEAWALPDGCSFVQASGTAHLDKDKSLLKSAYEITYRFGSATVTKTVSVTILPNQDAGIVIPEDTSIYTYLAYIDGPRMLETASGYLLQAAAIEGQYTEDIQCKAFGDTQEKNVVLKMDTGKDFSAEVASVVTLTGSSRTDGPILLEQTEEFQEGVYRVSTNKSKLEADSSMTEEAMISRCQNILLGTLPLSSHLKSSDITVLEECYRIEFSGNGELSSLINKNVCQTLYGDAKILERLASDHFINSLECYLEISKDTGLPVRSGIDYNGIYIIDNISYPLKFQAGQTYLLKGSKS